MVKSLQERFLDFMEAHPVNRSDRKSMFLEEVRSRFEASAQAARGKREKMWLEQLERNHAGAL